MPASGADFVLADHIVAARRMGLILGGLALIGVCGWERSAAPLADIESVGRTAVLR
jgi:hypothetical protein